MACSIRFAPVRLPIFLPPFPSGEKSIQQKRTLCVREFVHICLQKSRAISLPGFCPCDMLYFVMKRFLSLALILLLLCPLLPPARAEEGDTAAPDPTIYLVPEDDLPLPCPEYVLTEKRDFVFGGTVVCDVPLTGVSVTIGDENGQILQRVEDKIEAEDEDAACFPLWDRTYPFEDDSLSARTDFASLKPGTYTFALTASNDIVGEMTLYASPFTVEKTTALHTLIPNDLRGTWSAAEALQAALSPMFPAKPILRLKLQKQSGQIFSRPNAEDCQPAAEADQ